MVISINRKIITLCLGLAIATVCTPLVQCTQTDTTSKIINGIKIGSFLLTGAYAGYKSFKNLNDVANTFIRSDEYDALIRQVIDRNPRAQNTPLMRSIVSWGARTLMGTYAYLYGFISFMMIKNFLQETQLDLDNFITLLTFTEFLGDFSSRFVI